MGARSPARPPSLAVAGTAVEPVAYANPGAERRPRLAELFRPCERRVELDGRKARIALMSTIGATDRRGSHDGKRRAERLVRASGLPYTIVRPAWFDYNKPDENRLVMLQGDKPLSGNPTDGAIARRQLAEVLVRSLRSEAALRKTFELHNEKDPEQEDFDPVFAQLEADAMGALDGAYGLANMALDREPQHVLDDLEAVRASASTA